MGMIQDNWLKFRQRAIPKDAGQVQLDEMEKAFFAGATTALAIVQQFGDDKISEDQGVACFTALLKEVNSFSDYQFSKTKTKGNG